ncbi:MAG: CPBP family intramembrane glutamic endopeptidase [Vicinamibacterales bacterium]
MIGFLQAMGLGAQDAGGRLSIVFVMALSLADAVLVVGLVLLFLRAHRERVRDVLAGGRPSAREAVLGLAFVPAAFLIAVIVLGLILSFAPWLRNVPHNPLEDLLTSDLNRLLFGVVVIVAGGLREEIQRAFILHRFEQRLGGAILGLTIFSLVFGLGHLHQGQDVAIATGTLGAFWGGIYLWRRSVVAPAVSHAGFNVLEIVRHAFMTVGRG